MADDPVAFTDDQHKLFLRISHLIRSNPQEFQAAGKWLDALLTPQDGGERPPLDIIQAAARALLSEPPVFERLDPEEAKRQARRVLLVVWILTDPRPLATTLSITQLQGWAWGVEYLSDAPLSLTEDGKLCWDGEINRLYASMTLLDARLAEWEKMAGDAKQYAGIESDTEQAKGGAGKDDDKGYVPALQILNRYTKALQIIYDTGRKMESHPSTYAGKGETAIRDLLITALGSHFQNDCGERFNKMGKTDIFIEEQGESVLIAECKIWSGPKSYLGAIDQLLGYIRWHDARAAVILFANTKEIGPVLEHIKSATPTHHAFVKAEASDRPGWYCFELCQNNDPVQGVRLAVLCFHFPQVQDADVSR